MLTITLPHRCDRAATEELLPDIRAAAAKGAFAVDASQAVQIGQSMLQLLVSARATRPDTEIVASAALLDIARLTGLSETLFGEMVA